MRAGSRKLFHGCALDPATISSSPRAGPPTGPTRSRRSRDAGFHAEVLAAPIAALQTRAAALAVRATGEQHRAEAAVAGEPPAGAPAPAPPAPAAVAAPVAGIAPRAQLLAAGGRAARRSGRGGPRRCRRLDRLAAATRRPPGCPTCQGNEDGAGRAGRAATAGAVPGVRSGRAGRAPGGRRVPARRPVRSGRRLHKTSCSTLAIWGVMAGADESVYRPGGQAAVSDGAPAARSHRRDWTTCGHLRPRLHLSRPGNSGSTLSSAPPRGAWTPAAANSRPRVRCGVPAASRPRDPPPALARNGAATDHYGHRSRSLTQASSRGQ